MLAIINTKDDNLYYVKICQLQVLVFHYLFWKKRVIVKKTIFINHSKF